MFLQSDRINLRFCTNFAMQIDISLFIMFQSRRFLQRFFLINRPYCCGPRENKTIYLQSSVTEIVSLHVDLTIIKKVNPVNLL